VAKRCWSTLLPLVSLLAAGCLATAPPRDGSAWTGRLGPGPAPGAVVIDFALLERSLGDPYLNQELWAHADQLVVGLEKRAALEANGLRVGQLVGMTPEKLHQLLKSERWCIRPHRRIVTTGQTSTEYFDPGPPLPHCDYDLCLGGKIHEIRVDQGRFCLDVTPTLTPDGKTKLKFTPKVETGEQVLPYQPSPDQANWVFKIERPAKAYPELGWEVTLIPNEYLVIGAVLDQPTSLGCRALVQEAGPNPVQRLLVIRTNRSQHAADEPSLDHIGRAGTSPPLALQATHSAIRASRP
jgi:hypothetical protein